MTAAYRKLLHIILLFCPILLYSQNWEWQNPKPFGDRIEEIFFVDDQTGWCIPQNNTLYKTQNGGMDWEILPQDWFFTDVYFVSSQQGWGIARASFSDVNYSILTTSNGGVSWTAQLQDTTLLTNLFFLNDQRGWVCGRNPGSGGLLLETRDGGLSWQRIAESEFIIGDIIHDVNFADDSTGWVVGGRFWGIQTKDGGMTWEQDTLLANVGTIVSSGDQIVWAINGSKNILKSIDGGDSWISIPFSDTTAAVNVYDFFVFDSLNLVLASSIGVYRSIDGGMNWFIISSEKLKGVAFLSSERAWGVGLNFYAELFLSENGGVSWSNQIQYGNLQPVINYEAVDFVTPLIGWIVGNPPRSVGDNFVAKTVDGGETWFEQNLNSNAGTLDLAFLDEQIGYVIGENCTIFKTSDGGNTWVTKYSTSSGFKLQDIALAGQNHIWVVGSKLGSGGFEGIVLHSNDGGENWIDQTPPQAGALRGVSFIDSANGWIASGGGSVGEIGRIQYTADGGNSWSVQLQGNGLVTSDIQFLNMNDGWFVGGDPLSGAGLLQTSDGGNTWLPILDIFGIALHFIDGNRGWIVGPAGSIYSTVDGGVSWQIQDTYTTRWLLDVDFVDAGTGWVVGWTSTIMKTSSGGIMGIENSQTERITESYLLEQNYPNPFNNTTNIRFSLPKQGTVRVDLFNILGEKVSTIFNGNVESGIQELDFDSGSLPSGIYFYRLESERYSAVRKMVLMR